MMVLINSASLVPVLAAARVQSAMMRHYLDNYPEGPMAEDYRVRLAELAAAIAELSPFVK